MLRKLIFPIALAAYDRSAQSDEAITSPQVAHPTLTEPPTDWLTVTVLPNAFNTAVITIRANLDATTYDALIAKANELTSLKLEYLLVNLSHVTTLSTAGLISLHNLARAINGDPVLESDGWNMLHELKRDIDRGAQRRVKLFAPQPKVMRALEQSGLNKFFEVYPDEQRVREAMG